MWLIVYTFVIKLSQINYTTDEPTVKG